MGNGFGGITDSGGGRDGHGKAGRRFRANDGLLRRQHRACHGNTHRLLCHLDPYAQLLDLAGREKARSHVIGGKREKLRLARHTIIGIHVNHRHVQQTFRRFKSQS